MEKSAGKHLLHSFVIFAGCVCVKANNDEISELNQILKHNSLSAKGSLMSVQPEVVLDFLIFLHFDGHGQKYPPLSITIHLLFSFFY